MSVLATLVFGKKLNDINAMPKIFPRKFIKYMKNAPFDFSLDVYFLVIATQKKYKIIEKMMKSLWNTCGHDTNVYFII